MNRICVDNLLKEDKSKIFLLTISNTKISLHIHHNIGSDEVIN